MTSPPTAEAFPPRPSSDRLIGLLFGSLTQVIFVVTVCHLVPFLAGHEPAKSDVGEGLGPAFAANWSLVLIDTALACGFAVPHSLLLHPVIRRRIIGPGIRTELYGCFFCTVTCWALLVTMLWWQPSHLIIWAWPRAIRPLIHIGFLGCWGLLLYSLSLTGLGYQTGRRDEPFIPKAWISSFAIRCTWLSSALSGSPPS
jgi:hypothetical protein